MVEMFGNEAFTITLSAVGKIMTRLKNTYMKTLPTGTMTNYTQKNRGCVCHTKGIPATKQKGSIYEK